MKRTTIERITRFAKRDGYAKAVGGFAIAELSNGDVDYFPAGQPPHIAGEPDRQARIVAKYRWNGQRWSRIA